MLINQLSFIIWVPWVLQAGQFHRDRYLVATPAKKLIGKAILIHQPLLCLWVLSDLWALLIQALIWIFLAVLVVHVSTPLQPSRVLRARRSLPADFLRVVSLRASALVQACQLRIVSYSPPIAIQLLIFQAMLIHQLSVIPQVSWVLCGTLLLQVSAGQFRTVSYSATLFIQMLIFQGMMHQLAFPPRQVHRASQVP